jgi:hypothetical protein
MSSALLLKLQSESVLNHKDDQVLALLYQLHISYSDSKLSAYYFLHALLLHALNATDGHLRQLPHYKDSMDITKFASQLFAYCQSELAKNHFYTDKEISLHFLQELETQGIEVQVQLKALEDLSSASTVPDSLRFTTLALQIPKQDKFSTRPTSTHGITHRLQRSSADQSRDGRRPDVAPKDTDTPFRKPEDVQCQACNIWGHSAQNCTGLAKIASVNEYITAHKDHATTAVRAWKTLHSAKHRKAIAHSLHALTGVEPTTIALDDLTDSYIADF